MKTFLYILVVQFVVSAVLTLIPFSNTSTIGLYLDDGVTVDCIKFIETYLIWMAITGIPIAFGYGISYMLNYCAKNQSNE